MNIISFFLFKFLLKIAETDLKFISACVSEAQMNSNRGKHSFRTFRDSVSSRTLSNGSFPAAMSDCNSWTFFLPSLPILSVPILPILSILPILPVPILPVPILSVPILPILPILSAVFQLYWFHHGLTQIGTAYTPVKYVRLAVQNGTTRHGCEKKSNATHLW